MNHSPPKMPSISPGFLRLLLFALLSFSLSFSFVDGVRAQHSIARQWNDLLLEAIRKDFARPTVHSRNLFHVSVGMYDAWAAYDTIAVPYLLGDSVGGFACSFTGVPTPSDLDSARNEAISYAAYRILKHRFQNSPGASISIPLIESKMASLGYDTAVVAVNYGAGSPATLGNYIAQSVINFGLQDNANEQNDYVNQYYNPVNNSLLPMLPGNPNLSDPNRWQPLTLTIYIDQGGNVIPGTTPDFLGPEWGNVIPFSLNDSIRSVYTRNGNDYVVYHDPIPPPYLDTVDTASLIEEYQWGFSLVSVWSSHLDSANGVMWDISPASIGNVQSYPTTVPGLQSFYNLTDGGDPGIGYTVNPKSGLPYTPQIVPRADYARVLAEYWADGPDSETPPGHWFTLLNYVNDYNGFQKKWRGQGKVLDDLEWDVKAYFTMGGTVHDAAVTSWGIKGWYDYIRPISAIRYMADNGQSSDSTLANYAKDGIPLLAGKIELVNPADTILGFDSVDFGKIKVHAWRGPDYITDPAVDVAGVGWILAENWWPYQRPTFVTPPFAGYVSGHSTFSRAAAEVMTALTGDPYFPGGIGEFVAVQDSFLVFEDGPSMDITLQWATYRDASDQCSLSRIWGGIHPPADDMPGRLIGEKIGVRAFQFAEKYFDTKQPEVVSITPGVDTISLADTGVATFELTVMYDEPMDTNTFPILTFPNENPLLNTLSLNSAASGWLNDSVFVNRYDVGVTSNTLGNIDVTIDGGADNTGNPQIVFQAIDHFDIDTKRPTLLQIIPSIDTITMADSGVGTFSLTLFFDEKMDTLNTPYLMFPDENPLLNSLTLNTASCKWLNDSTFVAIYDVSSEDDTLFQIDVSADSANDIILNGMLESIENSLFNIMKGTIVISSPSKTGALVDQMEVTLYPNPLVKNSVGTLLLVLNKETTVQVDVYDVSGKYIFTLLSPKNLNVGSHSIVLPSQEFGSGTYIIQTLTSGSTLSKKIIIE